MKKLSLYVFLVLMFCNVGFTEEQGKKLEELFEFKDKDEKKKKIKIPDSFKPVTVNSLTKEGYKIVDIQQESVMLFYILQRSRTVYLCRVIGLGGHETRCFRP